MSITSKRSQIAFKNTEQALLKLSSNQEADRVHRFRTAVRRLQTLIEELIPDHSHNQKKLLKLLGKIRKRAGKVRDLDVQLAALRSLKIPQEPRRKTQLMHGLIELRAKHESKLRKILIKDGITREIRKRLRRASQETRFETSRDPLVVARTILAQVERPGGTMTVDVLHQFRVAVKRARYAAEFAPKSSEASQIISDLKRLQDAIGNWHDWLTLTQTASHRLGEVSQSSLVAALHNVTGGKFRQAVAALSASPIVHATLQLVTAAEHSRKVGARTPAVQTRTDSAA